MDLRRDVATEFETKYQYKSHSDTSFNPLLGSAERFAFALTQGNLSDHASYNDLAAFLLIKEKDLESPSAKAFSQTLMQAALTERVGNNFAIVISQVPKYRDL